MEQLFSHENEGKPCPSCNGQLQFKNSKRGAFLGCTNYPECEYIESLQKVETHTLKELGISCPECASELLLKQGRYGLFIGCSNFPDCQYISSLNEQEENSDKDALPGCPECHKGILVERHSRLGKTFYSCDTYPKCRYSINHLPTQGRCDECGYPLLIKKSDDDSSLYCADKKCQKQQAITS